MATPPEIKQLKELLEPTLDGLKVVGYSTKFLTSPGDNYGSTMLALSVDVINGNDQPQKLELVAKMRPSSEEFIEVFQINVTFKKEAAIYTKVVPALIDLQKEMNAGAADIGKIFCRSYNARTSLNPDLTTVDEDAVLILENLTKSNFVTKNRTLGFNPEEARFVLKNLATFHAYPIALRYLKPDIFNQNVRQYLNKIDMEVGMSKDVTDKFMSIMIEDLHKVEKDEDVVKRIQTQLEKCRKRQNSLKVEEDKPFFTTSHNDFWVNNMMLSYSEDGNPANFKIVDFQLIQMDSVVHDLIFFLFTSVNDVNFEENLDEYIKFYHEQFYKCLQDLNCPLEDFSYEKFIEEINRAAPLEFYHAIIMLKVVLAKKESLPEHSDLQTDMFFKDDIVGDDFYEKLKITLKMFGKKKWF